MENEKLLEYISKEVKEGRNVDLDYVINQIPYKIRFQKPDFEKGINIPSIIAIPLAEKISKRIILESNNFETDNFENIINQGIETGSKLVNLTKDKPGVILVPLIPNGKNQIYFQQLSRGCFELEPEDNCYRIDEQIVKMIDEAKITVKEETGVDLEDKIFLNGYSSSGVFAQRFSLLHPELIHTACIGGASGSIPVPIKNIGYPIGISDYKELTGKEFDMDSYCEIDFTYYVGELETINKVNTRFDDDGNPAPMHDMSYFDVSVPSSVGRKQREIFGYNMFERAQKTVEALKAMGIKIEHYVIPGRSHNNRSGKGVGDLADPIINNAYNSSIISSHMK